MELDSTTLVATADDLKYYPFVQELFQEKNPYLYSPEAPYELPFYQTRETLMEVERYRSFLENSIKRFRKSRAYKCYKAYLMSLGMNRCQILGNINEDMATIEMHHNILNIFDIGVLISQHILNTIGMISSFDLIQLFINEHKNNRIPIVMLSKTAHQIYHSDQSFYIPTNMTFGKWWELLYNYRYGITLDIAYKVIKYINNCEKNSDISQYEAFQLREQMKGWSNYNEYGYESSRCGYIDISSNYNHDNLYLPVQTV